MIERRKKPRRRNDPHLPFRTVWIVMALCFLPIFLLVAFLVYELWDFGIAGRVILYLLLLLAAIRPTELFVVSFSDWWRSL